MNESEFYTRQVVRQINENFKTLYFIIHFETISTRQIHTEENRVCHPVLHPVDIAWNSFCQYIVQAYIFAIHYCDFDYYGCGNLHSLEV